MSLTSILMFVAVLNGSLKDDGVSRYEIVVHEGLKSHFTVKASLPNSNALKISTYGAWSQPNGWGTYIEDLKAADGDGNSLVITETEKCTWSVPESDSSRINIEYKVNLAHATDESWPDGPKTTGSYWDGTALFTVTAPLILYTDDSAGFQFKFSVPKDCQILTAWNADSGPNQFSCENLDDAISNTIVLGKPDAVQVKTPCFDVTVAMLGEFRGKSELIGPVVEKYLDYYERLYQEKGKHNYLVVMFPQSMETGEAYSSSYVHVSPQIPSTGNRPIWSGIVAHELGHFWLGKKIEARDWATSNWFSEGATEYMATLAMVRSGEISEEEFLDIIQRNVEFYILFKKGKPFESVSLVEAGSNKSSNNVAIYNGGWVACFCLDVLIREQTSNQKSFDDFMRRLDRDFGQTGTKYDLGDLIHAANSTSESSIREFFDRYVVGKESIPMEDFLQRAGLTASIGAASAYVDVDSNSTGLPKEIRLSLFNLQPSELEQSIDKIFEKWNHKTMPGAAVTITRGDRILLQKSYGNANLEFRIPIDSETVFHAASVAKQFTAYLVLLLEERGKLSLDDPVSRFLPAMQPQVGAVKIRQLLNHTSGIRDQWQLLALSGVQPEDVVSQDQVLRLLRQQTGLQFSPGSEQAYCNSGYSILATIVEEVTGQSFREYSTNEIFRPLGMDRTFFRDSIHEYVPGRATSYRVDEDNKADQRELNYVTYGATSLHTCGNDVAKWMLHLSGLHEGGSPILMRMMDRGKLNTGEEVNFSCGLFIDTYKGKLMFGHPGADAGFRSSVFVFPELKLGVAILANTNNINHWQLPKTIADIFLDDPLNADTVQETETEPDSDQAESDKWVGSFVSEQGDVVVVDKRFGKLCVSTSPDFRINELNRVSGDKYRVEGSQEELQFVEDKIAKTNSITISSAGKNPKLASQRGRMTSSELESLIGTYYSSELDASYSLTFHKGTLRFEHLRNGVITLTEKSVDRFSSDAWFVPEVQFIRNQNGSALAFEVRMHDERGIEFKRTSRQPANQD